MNVKKHIELVKKKTDKNMKTYKQVIDNIILDTISKIKRQAFLTDKFNNMTKDEKTLAVSKKKSFFNAFKKINPIKKEEEKQKLEEMKRKDRDRRETTKMISTIKIEDIERADTTNKFLESEENEKNMIGQNDNIYNINNDFDKEQNEIDNDKKKDNIEDNKNKNINLKKTFTIGVDLFSKDKTNSKDSPGKKVSGLSFVNRLKMSFAKDKEDKKKFISGKIFHSLIKKKSYFFNKSNLNSKSSIGRRSSVRQEISLSYQQYLIRLGKIYEFIQYFRSLDLDKSLFINDHFMNLMQKEQDNGGNIDNSLYIFFQGVNVEKGNNCYLDKNIVNYYMFYLYNKFFPNIESDLKEKIKEGTITGQDIINEIKEDINKDEDNSKNDDDNNEEKYKKDRLVYFEQIDENLCILYSIFQFLINQYVKTLNKLFNLKCNFCLNFLSAKDISKIKNYFLGIVNNLLSRIVFLNKEYLGSLYNEFMIKTDENKIIFPNLSLLNPNFDLDNQYLQNKPNKKGLKRSKKDKFSRKEAMLIENLYFFLKKCDEIKYLYQKMIVYKYIKNLIDYEKSKDLPNNDNDHDEDNNINESLKLSFNEQIENKNEEIILLSHRDSIKENKELNKQDKKLAEPNKSSRNVQKEKDPNVILGNLLKICNQINNQKIIILESYVKLSNSNSSLNNTWNSQNGENRNDGGGDKDKFMVLKIKEKSDFITQLLKNYEIKKFFNNIIYMESEDNNIISDKDLKKLRRVRGYFEEIEKEIFKLKLFTDNNFDKEKLKEELKRSLAILNRYLGKISIEQRKLFKIDDMKNRNKSNELTQMFIFENESFYKKIKFNDIFEKMIENINNFKNFNDKSILIYCSYLLKIFINLKKIDNNFHRNIVKYQELYESLIYKSLKCINQFYKTKITDEEPLFLNVSFLSIEAFIIILKNSKLNNIQLKIFMENTKIFSELMKVYKIYMNKKYKIIYQILYTFAVSRVLLFLNKQGSYANDTFFEKIYPASIMSENIYSCFETINNSLDKEHIISKRDSDLFVEEEESNSLIKDEEFEDNFSKFIQDDEKEGLINSDIKVNYGIMNLNDVYKKEDENADKKSSQEKENSFANNKKINNKISKEEKDKNQNERNDFLRWENENEPDKLSFYLNFISVYVVYLKDKNGLMKENKDEFQRKEIKEKTSFSFITLFEKIKAILDTEHNHADIGHKEKSNSNTPIDYSILKEEKNYFGEDVGCKNVDYKFLSVLLESILVYRNNLSGQNIEIQIKKAKNKEKIKEEQNEESFFDEETESLKPKEESSPKKKERDNIIFYYYNPEYIDIILLEKILNEIELKDNISSYCLEDSYLDKENSYLLNELFKDRKAYRIIQTYYDEEYSLIHNYFVKNNMELLINNILKSFDSNDFAKIAEMENYLYKRMGEIYSSDNKNNDSLQKNNSLVEFLIINEQNRQYDLKKINIVSFFGSLVYIYQKFRKSTSIIYYKIGFELLLVKCKDELIKNFEKKNEEINEDDSQSEIINEYKLDLESITKILILLFSSEINIKLIKDKKVFATMLSSIKVLLLYILSKGGNFIFKNIEILKELFNKLNFIFDKLSLEFEKIVSFMKKPNKTKDKIKFDKKKNKLQNILDFLIIFLEFKKINEDILTEEIYKFTSEVVEKAIKLVFILLQLPNDQNFEAIDILLEFLFNFIKGPDIKNINLLFSLGFFDLVVYVIRDLDYYKIFLNYLSKDDLYKIIDNYARAECKIIKIFIIYYNICHIGNNIEEFENLQNWYEANFDLIKKKLKRLYYISQKEMEEREYNIDKMLLFMKEDDNYDNSELKSRAEILNNSNNEIYEKMLKLDNENKNQPTEKENKFNQSKEQYCIIKFDLLLAYYSLYDYHMGLSSKTILNISKRNIFFRILLSVLEIIILIFRIITILFYAIYFIIMKLSIRTKTNVDLLQELNNIETESQLIDEQNIIDFLKKYIKELEISLNNVLYKVYFPMLNKANTLEKYKEEYYKVELSDSSDFINYLLSNYDSIHIKAKEYVSINKIINLPIINVFYKNSNVLGVILILFSLISNILIMLSYNNDLTTCDDDDELKYKNNREYVRLECPHLLYNEDSDPSLVLKLLKIFGIIELALQTIIFIDYIVRIFSVEQAKVKLKYRIEDLKKGNNEFKMRKYLFFIILEVIFHSIFNFRSLYYILSIIFICLGLAIHPFFYCITLLEFVNRIQLMQTVLRAMYEPIGNILITLLMFIILEYLFSLFAVSYFTYQFPNLTDTSNFIKTFMRAIEQTFKQDGGLGTYLNKALDQDYTDYTVSAYFNIKIFYDLLFYLLILSLIFQLFLSTIIDHFNETRENNDNFQEGLETNCTVCGMDRETIEKIYSNNKNAFERHIIYFHNAFNYIYYLMYLQSSSFKDTVIENGVWSLHLNKNLSYLPKNKCFKELEKKSWKKLDMKKKEGNEEDK